jgi:uracil-DNA glycosylase
LTETDPLVRPGSLRDERLHGEWARQLDDEFNKDYWRDLVKFVDEARASSVVYPPPNRTFAAFEKTPFECVNTVILGQDPYHGHGLAHGLAFSVQIDAGKPPSLRKIHEELERDLGIKSPEHGNLEGWAEQGVMLLNTTLTVRDGSAGSHQGQGWEIFTDEAVLALSRRPKRVVFLLWGDPAIAKRKLIDESIHSVIETAHPKARFNAKNPLVGSGVFSRTNAELSESDRIDWSRFEAKG